MANTNCKRLFIYLFNIIILLMHLYYFRNIPIINHNYIKLSNKHKISIFISIFNTNYIVYSNLLLLILSNLKQKLNFL